MSVTSIPEVRKSVIVRGTPERCFRVFTEQVSQWWPPTHVLLKNPRVGLAFEPSVGGRYFEWDAEGNEITWGRILEWDPPRLLRLTWRVDGRFQSIPDDTRASEIEVRFTGLDEGTTRVELAHVKLERHGADAEKIFHALSGPSPGETLQRFADVV